MMLGMLALAACDGSTGPNGGGQLVTLSFATNPTSGGAALSVGTAGTPSFPRLFDVTPSPLVITSAQVVLSRLELTANGGTPCDDEHMTSDCREIERSFVLVDLPVDTAVQTFVNAGIPAGTYSSLEARMRVPDTSDHDNGATFLAAHPEFANANVRVVGTYNGTPFTYTGAVDARLELGFVPPAVVDTAGLNITVRVDLSSWFADGHGGVVDPSTALANGANAELVATNIRNSFHAFEDHEHGGRDGHGDGHEGPGGGDDHGGESDGPH